MVQKIRPLRARKACAPLLFFRNIFAVVFAMSIYIGSVQNAQNLGVEEFKNPRLINAELQVIDNEIITGSINSEFFKDYFGPNRALKVSRDKNEINILDFAASFEPSRVKIASLRNKKIQDEIRIKAGEARAKRIAQNISAQKKITPIAVVASIDDNISSLALDAISSVDKNLPSPLVASKRLAYARAKAPVTVFKSPISMRVSSKQKKCLSTAIYFEARGEIYRGQVAVAQVVMNRVKSKLYPNTICGVVFQNQQKRNACQFSFACDGIPERISEKKAWKQAQEITNKVMNGSLYLNEVANATHYHANYVRPKWAKRMKRLTVIGVHKFYRFKKGWNWS